MLKKSEKYVSDIRRNTRGGDGEVEITDLIPPEYVTDKCRLFARVTLKQGVSIGYHTHENEFETYYIISGKGIANDDGVEVILGPGDGTYTGFGAGHSIKNIEPEPLVFIALILSD